MKIAYVIGGLPFGGVESWLFDLCHGLPAAHPDLEPIIVNVSGTGQRHQEFKDSGLDVVSCANSESALATHRVDTVCAVRRQLRRIAPDIIHTLHFSGDYFGRLGGIGQGARIITHLRNTVSQVKGRRRLANKLLSHATDLYLCVSREVARTVAKDHNRAGKPVRVLYNAIDLDKLDVPALNLAAEFPHWPEHPEVILAVGRMVEQKNFPFLLQVMKLVQRSRPNARCLLVGDGGRRAELEAEAASLGLNGIVEFLGYRPDVPALMRASTLLAMPSLYEGFPITHIEAMGCGLPAVISPHVPSREVCDNAAVVCELNEERFAAAIVHVLTDKDRYESMRASALEQAPHFSMAAYLDQLAGIYRDLHAGQPITDLEPSGRTR